MECTCFIFDGVIQKCPLCRAAPDLYEACLQMEAFLQTWEDVLLTNMTEDMLIEETNKLYPAITRAEGKP